ncbi:MAG: dimeric dUTPase (all-alpha-NTP-PPase superfamily) [Gammaproteobacteria bacterium]|jgi:dimeric dUTPase (all-alpha-NTP-PPase superfamily)
MKNKLHTMLEMQDSMNSRVNADWRLAKSEWYRAIWTECAEMLEHYGWKWWKHQQPDLDQVRLELVDIFHFAMSDYLLRETNSDAVVERIVNELSMPGCETDIPCAIEAMAHSTIANQSMSFSHFANVMQLIDMDFDQLYRLYVGKNVLNFFRQDNGYKDGSYIKIWNGLEDNEQLTELLNDLDSGSADFKDHVYQGLQARYPG